MNVSTNLSLIIGCSSYLFVRLDKKSFNIELYNTDMSIILSVTKIDR